jgi:hypothetical protein
LTAEPFPADTAPPDPAGRMVRPAAEVNPVPMVQWSRDHWTTFAYAMHRVVNGHGKLEPTRMRCHPRLHRTLVAVYHGRMIDGSNHPTRLKDGTTVAPHDDWSCVEDMVALDLLKVRETGRRGRRLEVFGNLDVYVTPTDAGWALWHRLERWIAEHQATWSTSFESPPMAVLLADAAAARRAAAAVKRETAAARRLVTVRDRAWKAEIEAESDETDAPDDP